jgi:hypothetical protein
MSESGTLVANVSSVILNSPLGTEMDSASGRIQVKQRAVVSSASRAVTVHVTSRPLLLIVEIMRSD